MIILNTGELMPEPAIAAAAAPEKKRLLALDIFRGLTIATMITVNDPGIEERAYAPLLHAKWNGITPTDFVFPSFIYMVGISVALSYSGQLARGVARSKMIKKMLRRALILFIIGVFLSTLPYFDFSNYRIAGVLPRIALVYVAGSLLFLYTGWKFQAGLGAAILIAYSIVMTTVPVPGYGYAILEPGKNLAAWLDAIILPGRMWQGTWDPEGVLSSFPAVCTGIAGLLTGHLLLSKATIERKVLALFFAGFLSLGLALIWNAWLPINKNLWTSSFVFYTAGVDAMILASLCYLTDILGHRRGWTFAMIYGSNAIAAYLVAEVFSDLLVVRWTDRVHGTSINEWVMEKLLPTGLPPELISLAWALAFCGLCFIPVYILYRKKIFLKI